MAERFERLYKSPDNLYTNESPIIISAGALLKDNQTGSIVVQLKFHSVSENTIKAVKVSLSAFDVSGMELQGVKDYQYLELSVRNGEEFGSNKAIVLPSAVTRTFSISDIVVVFSDGNQWKCEDVTQLKGLPTPKYLSTQLHNAELEKQYKIFTTTSAMYVPSKEVSIWSCTCGEWNIASQCTKCSSAKQTVFSAIDVDTLQIEANKRIAMEQAQRAEAERRVEIERQEKEKQLALKAARHKAFIKKLKKILAIVVPILVLTVTFVAWVYPDVIKPNVMYKEANELLLDGQYDAATAAFRHLGDFKDAQEMSLESQYQKAEQFIAEKLYDDAINTFRELAGYKDSSERIIKLNELLLSEQYEHAMSLFKDSAYKDAAEVFKALGEYKDSKTQMQECYYQLGKSYIDNAQITEAIAVLKTISGYKNSDSLLKTIYEQIDTSDSILDFFSIFSSGMTQEEVLNIVGDGYSRSISTSSRRSINYLNSEPRYVLNSIYADWIRISFYEESDQELFTGTLSHISWWHETSGKQLDIYEDVYQYLYQFLGDPDSKEIYEEDYTVTWGNIELWVFYRDSDNTTVISLGADY